MKTPFDTTTILFQMLNGKTTIDGGVYTDDNRPDGSVLEDIEVNTITLEQDALPQIGTSNINIYVSDTSKKINGKVQLSANDVRLKALTDEVLAIVRGTKIDGVKAILGNITKGNEPMIKQHFVNIRVDWNIQID